MITTYPKLFQIFSEFPSTLFYSIYIYWRTCFSKIGQITTEIRRYLFIYSLIITTCKDLNPDNDMDMKVTV